MPEPSRPVRVLVLDASLRKESFNVRLAGLAARTAAAHGAEPLTAGLADLTAAQVAHRAG